ncbi:MAG: acetolactate decarboxylase [Actinomycetia bacterium]|nr:acetolactate decarboxylase [Actinomycetes bacterium]
MTADNPSTAAIYQTGTINSLVNAVYDGDRDIAWMRSRGDFGLGTFAMVDGELIVCDGTFYRADANADLSVSDEGDILPFAVVSHFTPEQSFGLFGTDYSGTDYSGTAEYLARYFVSKNFIYTIRIDGLFNSMRIRSEECQPRTYRKLAETMPDLQRTYERDNIEGTLVGVWFPDYLSQINVAGFHFHFVDRKREIGGHVLDFDLVRGRASIQTIKSLQVDLIDNKEFAQADLSADAAGAVNQVERQ